LCCTGNSTELSDCIKGGNLSKTSLQISFVRGPVLSKRHSFLITDTRIEGGGGDDDDDDDNNTNNNNNNNNNSWWWWWLWLWY
jgi:hypothetical protein